MSTDIAVPPQKQRPVGRFWASTIGKKTVMAVTGLALVAYLFAHMLGNLKIFLGAADINGYAAWLRTIGEPALPYGVFLWIARVGLIVAVVLHIVAAAQLSLRDRRARPVRYVHGRVSFATSTMRWGGATLAVYVVWHILDLTVGVANRDYVDGQPYHNIVADFSVWWVNVIYIVALLMLGLHLNHGFASAARTLGVATGTIRTVGTVVAVVITGGFLVVPIAVMTGLVA
ncbi:succinate dehydrogenase cytochrome b subunit [Kutzneria buriramensis]|uniref:Succinate dehydrogenase / fumarate reductase cytochrome b subunit n=1 Tax=Kutzneria buriramensis TaxID=1045776 RepID=A0A3E0HPQ2_9PSEU|nr:succinate dehydrogenase cytochrome b subunit [Kutzneria buriramensis]REH48260.1 succinate dehydrogenase / fumarate reductase cytochrome b subunit [Kutzneria buriramensis]